MVPSSSTAGVARRLDAVDAIPARCEPASPSGRSGPAPAIGRAPQGRRLVDPDEERAGRISRRALERAVLAALRSGFCALLSCLPLTLGAAVGADETVVFQQGLNGYGGTCDLHLSIPANFMGTGHRESEFVTDAGYRRWEWDGEDTWGYGTIARRSKSNRFGWGDNLGLLRFRDIFGEQPGQVPPLAEIVSASLVLQTTTPYLGDSANLHRVLVEWDDAVSWQAFGPEPGPNMGVDYSSRLEANTGPTLGAVTVDVTESLKTWSRDPSTNRGWIFVPVPASQDIIRVQGSTIDTVTKVTVRLMINTPQRGELVATLRHGDYTALLLDRIGVPSCDANDGSTADDLDVTLDDGATADIHFSGGSGTLTGTWRPDGSCFSLPLCTGGGTGGLCGQSADGDWILDVADEWLSFGSDAVLISWGITVSDGAGRIETYTSSPGLAVPKRNVGDGESFSGKTSIWGSETETASLRPRLSVTFRPTPVFSPTSLTAYPDGGIQFVDLRIPDGSNAGARVTVEVVSDNPQVARPMNSPLEFARGGPTTQALRALIGQAGSARFSTRNDAELPDITLPVTVAATPIVLSPPSLYRAVGSPDETIDVTIPLGSNAMSDLSVTVSTSDPNVVDLAGSSGGSLRLTYPAGAPATQKITLIFGWMPGAATVSAREDRSLLEGAEVSVVLTPDPPVEYELHLEPYVQIGNAPSNPARDQFVVAWQTLTRSRGGPIADRFEFAYRRVGDEAWTPVPVPAPVPVGSPSRLNHTVTVTGLPFDQAYEYRVVHTRNGVARPGGTFQSFVRTQKTGGFRFTAFGNSGLGSGGQEPMARLLATLGSDLHLLLGDYTYWYGEREHYKPRVNLIYSALMRSIPFVHALGNHDGLTENGQPTIDNFYVPENGPAALAPELNYSFDFGNVHFVSVNSGRDIADLQQHVGPWLRADLAASRKTWKVVFTHEPPLTRDPYRTDRQENPTVRDAILKVAVEEGADLFLAGGVHSFQRYLPITAVIPAESRVEWSPCPSGPGTTLIYPGTGAWFRTSPGPIPDTLEPPMELYAPRLGVAIFDVNGSWLRATLIDEFGGIIDSVTLSKCAACGCPSAGVRRRHRR
ncbi:MAG: metallophosphoesterase [Candidatus Rokubacteria bacterium]|nr:metallophosphoesterase [Candidatus Rokubacteria bacterium]